METHFPFTDSTAEAITREQLLTDVKLVVSDIEHLVKSTAGQLSQKASEELQVVLSRARKLSAKVESRTAAGLRHADRVIRDHPYESMGLAFAAGALIGVLVNRK